MAMSAEKPIPEMPAEKVIRIFGGLEPVAQIVGLTKLQIRRWVYPKSRGGHDGQVPYRHHKVLLVAARDRVLPLTREDLEAWDALDQQGDAA